MIDWDKLTVGPAMRVFGEPVTFMPASNAGTLAITAIFTEHAKHATLKDGMDVVEEITTLGCQESQFQGAPPVQNDQFLVRGLLWRAAEPSEPPAVQGGLGRHGQTELRR